MLLDSLLEFLLFELALESKGAYHVFIFHARGLVGSGAFIKIEGFGVLAQLVEIHVLEIAL